MTSIAVARVPAGAPSVLAGLLWGFVYLAPVLLESTAATTIVGARYVVFGLAGAGVLAWRRADLTTMPHARAAAHAATGFVGYYLANVGALRLAGPTVGVAVIGAAPVALALIGSGGRLDRRQIATLGGVMGGLVMIQQAMGDGGTVQVSHLELVGGTVSGIAAIGLWCWYALDTRALFQECPELDVVEWTAVLGLHAAIQAIPLLVLGELFGAGGPSDELAAVIGVSVLLGIGATLFATAALNLDVPRISPGLLGTLVASETVAGFAYVHLATGSAPSLLGLAGEIVLIGALVGAARAFESDQPGQALPSGGLPSG